MLLHDDEPLTLRDRTRLFDDDLLPYLCCVARIVHEEFLAVTDVLLVLRVLHIALHLHGAGILHSRLHDDAFKCFS